jgi:hypothetical protein
MLNNYIGNSWISSSYKFNIYKVTFQLLSILQFSLHNSKTFSAHYENSGLLFKL